ncbi:MAG: TrpB-like pyridoxal phosphate-dependent enzyme [Planctomycetota bacterium]|nr:TrpB-like pyridoxal phosphate-dependent enzyme [Planctomycetota bacterium]MDW8373282.1 TrpB-like pyridoxal phosphate-dependent enzyme [Planctomycetota bacterium]
MLRWIPLPPDRLPAAWYNLVADLPKPLPPPLGPDGQPVRPEQLAAVFPMNIIEQEVARERWIAIPDEVRRVLASWRPTPLRRCLALERALGTPARIYVKDESVSPAGSHKPNTAVPQAWYNRQAGIERLTTETGAGQWGSALSFACCQFGLSCTVFMVRVSFDQKPFRQTLMRVWGGRCIASPSQETAAGRAVLERDPRSPGSLGIAISEAVEAAISDTSGKTRYALGSVLNHVCLHQTIIGLEALEQLRLAGERLPDVVIGCAGGGSNFAGLAFPFVREKIAGAAIRVVPVEPASCPTLTRTPYTYDHGDIARLTPLLPMHSLGHAFVPSPIHAGGLRYHGMAPLVSALVVQGLAEPVAIDQRECFAAAIAWARSEGTVPAPETSHALAAVIREARRAAEEGKERVILACYSGHGFLDLVGYQKYLDGELSDSALSDEEIARSLRQIAHHPRPSLP